MIIICGSRVRFPGVKRGPRRVFPDACRSSCSERRLVACVRLLYRLLHTLDRSRGLSGRRCPVLALSAVP
jgi:hypothetical protein